MTYAYSNNGMSFRAVDADYEPQEGEVIFTDMAGPDQISMAFPGYAAQKAAIAWAEYQAMPVAALDESDRTVLRCHEDGVPVPAAWVAYRKALRTIVGAATGDATKPLPTRPEYPVET